MGYCFICGKSKGKSEAQMSHHRFPKKVVVREKWLIALNLEDNVISTNTGKCSSVKFAGRGGFNNNPSAYQFRNAYRRLLGLHQIAASENANCLELLDVQILHVGSDRKTTESLVDGVEPQVLVALDHQYFHTCMNLTPFVEDIVVYICGFVSKKVYEIIHCDFCKNILVRNPRDSPLQNVKDRGGLTKASVDVSTICLIAESKFRQVHSVKDLKSILYLKHLIFVDATQLVFLEDDILQHIRDQNPFNNHRTQLIKLIISKYVTLRIHHYNGLHNEKDKLIRHQFTKLILHSHQ